MPSRNASSSVYRYGFQGQEKDDEIKGSGNSLNYTFRMHDPRVGRFFAVDPLFRKYPFYTPYSFSGNKVTAFTELEGLEESWVIRDSKIVKAQGPTITVADGFKTYDMALIGLHFKMHNQQSLDTFMALWDEGVIDPTGIPKNQSYVRATQPEWEKYPEHYMGYTMAPYMVEAGKEIVSDAFVAGVLSKAKKLSKLWDFIKVGLKTGGAVSRNAAAVSNELRAIYKRIKFIESQNLVLANAGNDLRKYTQLSVDEMKSVIGRGVGKRKNIYEPNPKHGKVNRGRANKAPTNPQESLDNSFELPGNTTRRIGADKSVGEFNIFDETHPGTGIFHGHSRSWKELSQNMKNVLIENGIVTRKGKIIK